MLTSSGVDKLPKRRLPEHKQYMVYCIIAKTAELCTAMVWTPIGQMPKIYVTDIEI